MFTLTSTNTFLGILLRDEWPRDIKYSLKLLQSKESKEFFIGLKVLCSIHSSNVDEEKRAIAETIIDALAKIIPSYIKKSPDDEEYVVNRTKIDHSIKQDKHPLFVLRRPSKQQNKVVGSDEIQFRSTTSGNLDVGTNSDEEDIKVISIEDPSDAEQQLISELKKDIIEPSGEEADISPGESEGLDIGSEDEEIEDVWVGTSIFKNSVPSDYLFDYGNKVKEELEEGLSLINPMEYEQQIDLNYSSAAGYQNIYQSQFRYADPGASSDYLTPDYTMEYEQGNESPELKGAKIIDASEVDGQRCAFGDGTIESGDGKIYLCSKCKAAYHESCGKLILEMYDGICKVCDSKWT